MGSEKSFSVTRKPCPDPDRKYQDQQWEEKQRLYCATRKEQELWSRKLAYVPSKQGGGDQEGTVDLSNQTLPFVNEN